MDSSTSLSSKKEKALKREEALTAQLKARGAGPVGLAKRTSSNLFRYAGRSRAGRRLDLSGFNRVVGIDAAAKTLEVEGLATYESVVDRTLAHGLAPLITPELKHITVGGAIVGIGIESNCFRYGFVHDGLLEAEVLLGDGRIVRCSAGGEHSDLFRALPNSYGTLGYVLRAKMRLMPVRPYVDLHTQRFDNVEAFLGAMRAATERADIEFVEGLFYSDSRLLLTLSRFTDAPPRVDDILRSHVFYRLIEERADVYLTTKDYLFRYDPDWFWNLPEKGAYRLFRRFAPERMRNSGFYKRYVDSKNRLLAKLHLDGRDDEEPLIQDWEVPWDRAAELTRYALEKVDLEGRPWIVTPIRTPRTPSLYPVRANALYYNLGCYCQIKKQPAKGEYYATRILDAKCFELSGIKMLYSSTFLARAEFDRLYGGEAYRALKAKYDPQGAFPDLYTKCVLRR